GHVLCVSGVRSLPKGQQASAAEKALGHFPACFRKTVRFTRKESFQDWISRQQALSYLRGELAIGGHLFR
ncbi:MAG: hypothetical protein WB630_24820, partial [Candidatus Acidiferrales bacterium]